MTAQTEKRQIVPGPTPPPQETSGAYYFYNSKTGEAKWTPPALLKGGTKILSTEERIRMLDKKKRGTWKTAENMTDDEAAKVVQGLFRKRKARKMIQDLVSTFPGIHTKQVTCKGSSTANERCFVSRSRPSIRK